MKRKNKLLSALLLAGIAMAGTANAQNVSATAVQTSNQIVKWLNGSTFTITNSQIQDNGTNVGINISPSFKLDVNGDINGGGSSTSTTNALRLGTNKILFHNGHVEDIFVGVGAGEIIACLYTYDPEELIQSKLLTGTI